MKKTVPKASSPEIEFFRLDPSFYHQGDLGSALFRTTSRTTLSSGETWYMAVILDPGELGPRLPDDWEKIVYAFKEDLIIKADPPDNWNTHRDLKS